MATTSTPEVCDLLILVDATASMGRYLAALNDSLPQIISLSALTNCFERIGLLAYRDYSDHNLLEWSGWMTAGSDVQPDLIATAAGLVATGGGDYPEATKTGLARAFELMRPEAKTLILLYSDAPPHASKGEDNGYNNSLQEQAALLRPESYSGHGPYFADWATAGQMLAGGSKKSQVICILENSSQLVGSGYYSYLSAVTQGFCMYLTQSQPRHISEVTIELLLAWMGVEKEGTTSTDLPAIVSCYPSSDGMDRIQSEEENEARKFFITDCGYSADSQKVKLINTRLTHTLLKTQLPKKTSTLQNFADTYRSSGRYRTVVTTHLRGIIERDVSTISLNPVFGSLWRTFCNDRGNENRQELLDLFGLKVEAIRDAGDKAKMKTWLEESYDYTAEVLETIASVPERLRFPCVYLDPTLVFNNTAKEESEDEEDTRPITAFRRDELLELGRSCDWRILKRLGRILTRLTVINSAEEMPEHIAATSDAEVQKIPMALASPEYGRKFWRTLLHIVVPGTMLSGRGAALLAALTIRLGVKPLMQAADTEMQLWRGSWNDLEVPETWSVNCLSLLMDADKEYLANHLRSNTEEGQGEIGLLDMKDRILFERLVDYKLLELNLDTTIHARVAWSPQKTRMPIGPIKPCQSCALPRSVTVMGPNSICGICYFRKDDPDDEGYKDIAWGATKGDNELNEIHWYECSVLSCRAQYVVYDVKGLRVRPKCHYCRNGDTAPTIECGICLSRMIWPEEYRGAEDTAFFICIGCRNDRATEIVLETTAKQLQEENGQDWLIQNLDQKLKEPFNNRTLYYTASQAKPLDDFADRVQVLPSRKAANLELKLGGKTIRNTQAMIDELHAWVFRRRTESNTCSLCFGSIRKSDLLPACGRSGCDQKVCKSCLDGWYGLNSAGSIINTAALHCPFCRRAPTGKTLVRHGMGVHALGSLKEAVDQSGQWIFAWCADCGHAKQFMERVCANGTPPELQRWLCDECQKQRGSTEKLRIRPCPDCGTETEKVSGCDHIHCPCQTHWCFFCGEKQDEIGIYEHMSLVHGGYYHGEWDETEEDENEEMEY